MKASVSESPLFCVFHKSLFLDFGAVIQSLGDLLGSVFLEVLLPDQFECFPILFELLLDVYSLPAVDVLHVGGF